MVIFTTFTNSHSRIYDLSHSRIYDLSHSRIYDLSYSRIYDLSHSRIYDYMNMWKYRYMDSSMEEFEEVFLNARIFEGMPEGIFLNANIYIFD
jgi:hypothetical protein